MSFSRIIKNRQGSVYTSTLEEPKKPLRIIPNESVVLRSAAICNKGSVKPSISIEMRQSSKAPSPNIHSKDPSQNNTGNTNELFDRNYIDDLLSRKTSELESRFKAENERSYQTGYEQGKIEGFKDGSGSLEPITKLMENINKELEASREQLLKNSEEILGRLSLEIAEAVIGEAAMKMSGGVATST